MHSHLLVVQRVWLDRRGGGLENVQAPARDLCSVHSMYQEHMSAVFVCLLPSDCSLDNPSSTLKP